MPEPKRPLKVFLCHASTDKPKVRELYRYLKKRGIQPWFDEEDLVGGQDWQVEIPKAIATSDAIIICLTKNSVDKEGYIQKEIKFALDKALEMPEGRIFLIPVKFEECEVPFTLSRYQWVDLTVESGYAKMMKALKFRASQLERSTVEISKKDIEEGNLAREKAEKEAVEKSRLEAKEFERQKAAKEKAESESIERVERERKEKELREKQAREVREKEKRETEKKEEKPATVKSKVVNQTVYWFVGFIVLVLGIIFLSSLNNPPSTPQPTPENTYTKEVAISTQNTVAPSTTLVPESTSTPINNKALTPFGENSPFELVFVSNEGDYMNLYQLRNNGEKRNLTENSQFGLIAQPSLSSDGKIIAFETDDGLFGIHIDTTSTELISSFGHKPQWNPINNEIVVVSDETSLAGDTCALLYEAYRRGLNTWETYWKCRESGSNQGTVLSNQQVYLIDLASNELIENIQPLIDFRGVDIPMWDFTGTKLAYVKNENVDFICIDEAKDKSEVVRIGCHQSKDFVNSFDFSPVSNEIVYSAEWKGVSNIYLLNTIDFSQTDLTTGTNNNYSPIWSNSGNQIAFVSDRDGSNEIYIMDIANSEVENLTLSASNDFSPIWSPDDRKIIFVSDRNGNLDIYSVDVDTLETINLTNTPNDEFFPIFIPSTLPIQEPTSTPSVTIDSYPTVNPVTAILNADPKRGNYPLTVNFSANLKLYGGSLVCSQNPECSYSWIGLKDLPQNVPSFSRTFDGPFTPTVSVIVCYRGMCDTASVTIEVTQ